MARRTKADVDTDYATLGMIDAFIPMVNSRVKEELGGVPAIITAGDMAKHLRTFADWIEQPRKEDQIDSFMACYAGLAGTVVALRAMTRLATIGVRDQTAANRRRPRKKAAVASPEALPEW